MPAGEKQIRKTLPLTIFGTSALVLLVIALFAFHALRDDRRMTVEASLKAVAELKIGQLENWLTERRADIHNTSEGSQITIAFERWLASGGKDAVALDKIHQRMQSLTRNYGYDVIVLFDQQGKAQLGNPGATADLIAAHELDALEAIRQNQTRLIDFHQSPGQPIRIGMIAPIKLDDAHGTHTFGALLLAMPAEKSLFKMLQHWPLPSKTGETVLARREGSEIRFIVTGKTRPMTARMPTSHLNLPTARVERGERGILHGARDYVGDPVLAYAERVPGTPWVLVAKQDQSEVDAPLARWASGLTLVVLALLGAAALATWSWWRAQANTYHAKILQQQLAQAALSKQAETALQESQARFKLLMDEAPVPMCFVNRDGALQYINRRFVETFGYSPQAIPTLNEWWQLAYPDAEYRNWVLDTWSSAVADAKARGVDIQPIEYRVTTNGGQVLDVEISGVTLGEDFLATFHDVTERRQLEQQRTHYREMLEAEVAQRTAELTRRTAALETANRDLESFSYSVSHDLRAPLRAIDGYIAMLLDEHAAHLDDEGQRMFGVVTNNARKMGHLIDDILAFSRAGRMELNLLPVNMQALVREVWSGLIENISGRAIELKLDDLPAAQCDPRAIRQVWQNLLDNALKFARSRNPALIHVSATEEGEFIRYSVADNGVGFNADYAGKLFVLFQRLHGMDEFEGTGVGLAIVKRFILKHGGQVEGTGLLGQGASFSFTLPKQPPHGDKP